MVFIVKFVPSPSIVKTSLNWKPFLPTTLINKVIEFFHASPLGGHFDLEHTFRRVQDVVYFHPMRTRISEFISSCTTCQSSKDSTHPKRTELNPVKSSKPFEHLVIDCYGPLKTSSSGNKYVVVAQDHFSKFVILQPCSDITAETLSEILVKRIITPYGCPVILHSDRGSNFTSEHFVNTCKRFGISQNFSTAYRPQSQGLVERFNRTMSTYFRSFVDKRQEGWDQLLPFLAISYNSAPHSITGVSPFSVVFGREIFLPVNYNYIPDNSDAPLSAQDYKEFLSQNLDFLHDDIRKRTRVYQEKSKIAFDSKRPSYAFSIGDKVWMVNHKKPAGLSKKLQPRFVGPYTILDINGCNATISLSEKSTPFVVHMNDLKPYKAPSGSDPEDGEVFSYESGCDISDTKTSNDCLDSLEDLSDSNKGVVDKEVSDPPAVQRRRSGLRQRPKRASRLNL